MDDTHEQERRRPDPVRWLWYAIGGRLPARYRTWVLHDLTCRTWIPRHLARAVIQVTPFAVALFLLVPGAAATRSAAVVAGLLLGLLYSAAYSEMIAEHRVVQAGYAPGTAAAVREEAQSEKIAAQAERYERMWRPSGTLG
jgi:hypothetical protein